MQFFKKPKNIFGRQKKEEEEEEKKKPRGQVSSAALAAVCHIFVILCRLKSN